MKKEHLRQLYRCMQTSRALDQLEADLAQQGEATFHVQCAGHEATAALAFYLRPTDWLHCHYRDKALVLARGLPAADFLHSLLGTERSNSRGRRMPGFPCHPGLHLLSAPTVVGNSALQAAGVAAAVRDTEGRPVVLCSVGEGATQQGEFLEAVAETVRSGLPVLFLIQDNRYALSTPTRGQTFYSLPEGESKAFMGIRIRRVNGRDALECAKVFSAAVRRIRARRKPELLVLETERLTSHTNADDHTVYRSTDDIQRMARESDPVALLRARLPALGISAEELQDIDEGVDRELAAALKDARATAAPGPDQDPKRPLPATLALPEREYRGHDGDPRLTMLAAMRAVLDKHLAGDSKVILYGEDIEDPKGDVFGLTRGLSTRHPGRVRNSPLSEATIAGVTVGRALAGQKPVALLQFADFMPLAYNQIFSELGSMYWRTAGSWECPVLLMAICGGYRPGLGPFHAQTPVVPANHVPGLDVYLPSTAADAAGLLNAALASGRPGLFLYPKNAINDPRVATSTDVERHFVPIGKASVVRRGSDLTLVSYGSTMPFCREAVDLLAAAGLSVELIDLRTLYPWDRACVLESARKTGRLLVVHEDQETCGLGAEILAAAAETLDPVPRMRRVAGADGYVPYHFASQLQVLPSLRSILDAAAGLLDLELRWEREVSEEAGMLTIHAIGSSPSDETITLTHWHIEQGKEILQGAPVASVEADKAAMEISSPAAGTVVDLLLKPGDKVPVGTPIARMRVADHQASASRPAGAEAWRPVFGAQRGPRSTPAIRRNEEPGSGSVPVYISSIASALGSRLLTNEAMVAQCPGWTPADIVQRTGIEKRHWIGPGENVLSLAVAACRKLLEREALAIESIDAIVCSTGTPLSTTPSLACRILRELGPQQGELLMQAHDVNAACSGYLYALQQVWDILQQHPDWRVLLVTAETLSPMLNSSDPQTYFIFGDAATASLLSREQRSGNIMAQVRRPHLSAMGVAPEILYVPAMNSGEHVLMDGKPVFRVAVRKMIDMLEKACAGSGLAVDDLDLIVPHQANERIIEAIRKTLQFPTEKVAYYIRDYGNTSSNTIPLSLEALIPSQARGARIGMTAFGGGFTFAAGVLDLS